MRLRWLILFAFAASARAQDVVAPANGAAATPEAVSADRARVEAASPSLSGLHVFTARSLPDLTASIYQYRSHLLAPGGIHRRGTAAPSPARAGGSASRSARATTARVSCSADCKAVLPFHQPPIDADGILSRCNTGLAGPVVGLLHGILSQH